MSATEWALIAVTVVVLLAVVGIVAARTTVGWGAAPGRRSAQGLPARDRPRAAHRGTPEPGAAPREKQEKAVPRAAVIVNPTKFDDVEAVKATVAGVCREEGWEEPLWLETTEDDPGAGQTRQALDEGVDLVCPLGGDGTVRTVGDALKGTDTPMGLLPGGTGNLLARNLDLPIDSIEEALRTAIRGEDKRIDVGSLTVDGEEPYTFLVMAGMGFDADIMANTDEDLKAKVGWAAYLVSGARHLVGKRFKARITSERATTSRRTRSIIVGNVGKLQGGMMLMPDAVIDDGRLDVLILSPRGVVGWAGVVARLATKRHKGHQLVTRTETSYLSVKADRPVQLQVDGDPLEKVSEVVFEIEPKALVVRVAA